MKEARQQAKEARKQNGTPAEGAAAAAFFETGVEDSDDNDDDDGPPDIRKGDGEQTTDNSVWEPGRLLAYGLFLVRDIPSEGAGEQRRAVQMIEFGHAPLAQSSHPDGTLAEEGAVDTGGSDWSQHSQFGPSDEREPLAQLLLAHAIFQASLRLTVVQTVPSVQASACERNCIDAIKFNHIARAQMETWAKAMRSSREAAQHVWEGTASRRGQRVQYDYGKGHKGEARTLVGLLLQQPVYEEE